MTHEAKATQQWKIWLIACLFVLPVICAIFLFQMGSPWFQQRKNNGHLIQNIVQIKQLPSIMSQENQGLWKGKWSILYLVNSPCDAECESILNKIYKVRLALNKNYIRTQQVIIAPRKEYIKDTQISLSWSINAKERALLEKNLPSTALSEGLFIMDPLGNVMMSYPPNVTSKALYADLKVLLKASRIG